VEFSAPQLRDTAEPFESAVRAISRSLEVGALRSLSRGPGIVSEHLMSQALRPSRRLQNYCFQEE
jgi:hypothetical protein